MKILALDQSSKISGYSIFNDNKLLEYGHWTHNNSDIAIRIYELCKDVENKIAQYNPDLIVLENIAEEHQNHKTFQALAQVQGALLAICAKNNIKYKLIYPTEWRSKCDFLTGKNKTRASQKKIAQDWVLNTYNKKCTEDEADAICIGYSEVLSAQFDWSE